MKNVLVLARQDHLDLLPENLCFPIMDALLQGIDFWVEVEKFIAPIDLRKETTKKVPAVSKKTVFKKEDSLINLLIEKLHKEVPTKTNSYMGVEWDNLDLENEIESLFHKIMNELLIVTGNPDEYVIDPDDSDYEKQFKAFKSERALEQYINRLIKFVEKYAPKYLDTDRANDFIKEANSY